MITIAERVAAGAAFLDEHEPGWDQRIDLGRLNLASTILDVLGQLYGDYDDGLRAFAIHDEDARDLGFSTLIGFDELTSEWCRVITERRTTA